MAAVKIAVRKDIPQGTLSYKNTTVILIHYAGGQKKYDGGKNTTGRVSETPCFPEENSQEIPTDSELMRR